MLVVVAVVATSAVLALASLVARIPRAKSQLPRSGRSKRQTAEREGGRQKAGRYLSNERRGERILSRVEKMEERFAEISARSSSREPSTEMKRIMVEVNCGLVKMRQLASSLNTAQTRAEQDSLQRLAAETERAVSALISRLSRTR
ncbi:MAG: hypothetical protein ABIK43_05270 [candidate division WOR-3 bacterium]